MSEFDSIFAEPLATTVFLYGSVLMLAIYAAVALWIRSPKGATISSHPRPA